MLFVESVRVSLRLFFSILGLSDVADECEGPLVVIGLLVELQAWEQRTLPRPPVPDESAAGLRIHVGGEEARIWEWFNDMGTNQRLSRIVGMLGRYVSQTPAAAAPG